MMVGGGESILLALVRRRIVIVIVIGDPPAVSETYLTTTTVTYGCFLGTYCSHSSYNGCSVALTLAMAVAAPIYVWLPRGRRGPWF